VQHSYATEGGPFTASVRISDSGGGLGTDDLNVAVGPDADGDGFDDTAPSRHDTPRNTDTSVDNCPGLANPSQVNSDGNYVDNSPPATPPYPYTIDDATWAMSDALGDDCDDDDDNDGMPDLAEVAGCNGSGPLDRLNRDTDGDNFLDGPECALGTNAASAASKPLVSACGARGDADGDGIPDREEYCFYQTDVGRVETDGDITSDGADDGCEVASVNNDAVVNSADQLLLGMEMLRPVPPPALPNFDMNKDGFVNSADLLLIGRVMIRASCPN
jgi:hypothetical protein